MRLRSVVAILSSLSILGLAACKGDKTGADPGPAPGESAKAGESANPEPPGAGDRPADPAPAAANSARPGPADPAAAKPAGLPNEADCAQLLEQIVACFDDPAFQKAMYETGSVPDADRQELARWKSQGLAAICQESAKWDLPLAPSDYRKLATADCATLGNTLGGLLPAPVGH